MHFLFFTCYLDFIKWSNSCANVDLAIEKKTQKVCFQFRHSFHLVKQQYTKFLLKRIFLDFQWDTSFFRISNTFISNSRLKLAKNQAKAKQHPEVELLLFENYSLSSYILSSKTNLRYRKKCAKNKCVCFN